MSKDPLVYAFTPAVLAACAWLSLNPYFVWGVSDHLRLAALASVLTGVAAGFAGDRPRVGEMAPFALIAAFVVYISTIPTVDGAVIRWVYVLPTLLSLWIFSERTRVAALRFFSILFALSLLPAILVSLWCIAGLPITFQPMLHLNPAMADAGARYLTLPGALMLESNSLILPWGGVLFRICALYDEPGMVGTISALLLLSNRMDLKSPISWILLAGGALSFSVAFVLLAAVGLVYRLFEKPSAPALTWLTVVGLAGAMALGVVQPPTNLKAPSRIVIATSPSSWLPEVVDPSVPPPPTELRQTEYLMNRSLPEMDRLIANFWSSDLRTMAFGMGSDASVIKGGVSSVIDRIYTDYGLVGFALYILGFGSLCLVKVCRSEDRAWTTLFVVVFLLSAYQRPVIWLPYAVLILICGGIAPPKSQEHVPYGNTPP